MTIKIASLPLAPRVKAAILEAKYADIDELVATSADDLCAELGLNRSDVDQILSLAHADTDGYATHEAERRNGTTFTATALLESQRLTAFRTGCHAIDDLIHSTWNRTDRHVAREERRYEEDRGDAGSIVSGMTLEISGPPGGGKTAMAVAIAISTLGMVALDEASDMPEVLLVDTEGGLAPERILKALLVTSRSRETAPVRDLMHRVHLQRVATQIQMIAFLSILDQWLDDHPLVNLVIIDSLSFHFRQPGLDSKIRARVMETVKHQIAKATSVRYCAVVVTNQLATKLLTAENKPANFDNGDRAILMPQLGDTWLGGKTVRMVLFRGGTGDDQRYAHATLSNSAGGGSPWTRFDIDSQGLPCDSQEIEAVAQRGSDGEDDS